MSGEYLFRFSQVLFQRRPIFISLVQAIIIFVSLGLAFLLRFDFSLPDTRMLLFSGAILVVVRLISLRFYGLHHGWWSLTSVPDILSILKAVAVGSLVFFGINRLLLGNVAFPRSVYFLEAILTVALLAGARLSTRVLVESFRQDSSGHKRVILIGAGFAAQMLLRELSRSGSGYEVIGCFDDDLSKQRIQIQGVPVLGTIGQLKTVLALHPVDEILIAIPSATGKQMQRITDICQETKLPFKTVPALGDIIRGDATVSQLREVSLEDLLGREPIRIDLEVVRRYLQDKNVLVTGSAGSIGSELCRQILSYGPGKLVCLDQNETGIFYQQRELQRRNASSLLVFCVADVSDGERMRRCLLEHKVDYVFHAAAYKHVPVMEENVAEAIRNNVFSLQELLDVAEEVGCSSFLLISSDKAVNPTSVMGTSKRIGELILAARPKRSMRCVSVRFGNVLGSSGSVVPIFQEQLRKGKPLTITHPEIRRFFMTTEEAVSLVLQAFTIGRDGDILVLEMGTPVKILDMAKTLIRLSGKSEDSTEIQFTGLREGEKLEEELFYQHEEVLPTLYDKIKLINGAKPDWPLLCRKLKELRTSLNVDGAAPIRAKIKEIVPEYNHPLTATSRGLIEGQSQLRLRGAAAND
jgi:FlaA1/EpsC-like NDP-sugar epimerase